VVAASETATENQKNKNQKENKTVVLAAATKSKSHVYTTFLFVIYYSVALKWLQKKLLVRGKNPDPPGFMLFNLTDPGARVGGTAFLLAGALAGVFPGGRGFVLFVV